MSRETNVKPRRLQGPCNLLVTSLVKLYKTKVTDMAQQSTKLEQYFLFFAFTSRFEALVFAVKVLIVNNMFSHVSMECIGNCFVSINALKYGCMYSIPRRKLSNLTERDRQVIYVFPINFASST